MSSFFNTEFPIGYHFAVFPAFVDVGTPQPTTQGPLRNQSNGIGIHSKSKSHTNGTMRSHYACLCLLFAIQARPAHSFATDAVAKVVDRSHLPQNVKDNLDEYGQAYYCKVCAVGFGKEKNYRQHIAGRKHKQMEADQASALGNYVSDCPTWASAGKEGTSQGDIDVETQWRDSELEEFPHDHSCIQTSLTVEHLSPRLRARFWRYLHDSFGVHFAELPGILHHVSLHSPQYLRVKELFETCESFKLIGDIIVKDADKIDTIYDLACGHALLGTLLAYRFPRKKVVCVDLVERDSHFAFRSAFVEVGESFDSQIPLSNLEYRVADLLSVETELAPSSFLVALHACNEANKHVADMARGVGAGWAVMPCCIRSGLYLGGASVLDFSSEDRYKLLCGVFAEANEATTVRAISRHITARPILIAGRSEQGGKSSRKEGNDDLPTKSLRRGTMPPLI